MKKYKDYPRIKRIWWAMRRRCNSSKYIDFNRYGGRGIKVCDEWNGSYEKFYEDMSVGYNDKLSLDRIDNDGDYCKENCRWATIKEQNNNQRKTVKIGGLTLKEISAKYGIPMGTLRDRRKNKWTDAEMIKPLYIHRKTFKK